MASAADLKVMAQTAERVHVAPVLAAYLVDLADRSRNSAQLTLGMSPRACLGLLRAARVWAASENRTFVTPDDIKRLAVPVLAHRVVLAHESQLHGTTAAEAINDLLRTTPVPGWWGAERCA